MENMYDEDFITCSQIALREVCHPFPNLYETKYRNLYEVYMKHMSKFDVTLQEPENTFYYMFSEYIAHLKLTLETKGCSGIVHTDTFGLIGKLVVIVLEMYLRSGRNLSVLASIQPIKISVDVTDIPDIEDNVLEEDKGLFEKVLHLKRKLFDEEGLTEKEYLKRNEEEPFNKYLENSNTEYIRSLLRERDVHTEKANELNKKIDRLVAIKNTL